MAAKAVLVFCASALLLKTISAQYFGPSPFGPGNPFAVGRGEPLGGPFGPGLAGCGCGSTASTGGSFPVTSVSPIAPTGLKVLSENTIEGALGVGGQLPFLGTVALEGAFPSAGVGAISYGCGSGTVGITSEGPISTGILGLSPGPFAPAGPGYGPGFGPLGGCGCGVY